MSTHQRVGRRKRLRPAGRASQTLTPTAPVFGCGARQGSHKPTTSLRRAACVADGHHQEDFMGYYSRRGSDGARCRHRDIGAGLERASQPGCEDGDAEALHFSVPDKGEPIVSEAEVVHRLHESARVVKGGVRRCDCLSARCRRRRQ